MSGGRFREMLNVELRERTCSVVSKKLWLFRFLQLHNLKIAQ